MGAGGQRAAARRPPRRRLPRLGKSLAAGDGLKRAFAGAGIILDLAVFTEGYLIELVETGRGGFTLLHTLRHGEYVHADPEFRARVAEAVGRADDGRAFAAASEFRLSCLESDLQGMVGNMHVLAAECCWMLYSRGTDGTVLPGYPEILDACLERGIIDRNMFDRITRIGELKKDIQRKDFKEYKKLIHEIADLHPWVRLFARLGAMKYESGRIQGMLGNVENAKDREPLRDISSMPQDLPPGP